MPNTNYNAYLLMMVSEQFQIIGVNPDGSTTNVSDEDFAHKISISEDGTLWAISLEPDLDGGGGKIYYSQSANDWHEITSKHPGARSISGGPGSSCFYIDDAEGAIYSVQTDGTAVKHFSDRQVCEMGAGGGIIWALYGTNHDGDIPSLHYSNWNPPFDFILFKANLTHASPTSLSVDSKGHCYCNMYKTPWVYKHNSRASGAVAELVDNQAIVITKKNNNFIMTIDSNSEGNQILQMGGPGGQPYNYNPINQRAINICATFYKED